MIIDGLNYICPNSRLPIFFPCGNRINTTISNSQSQNPSPPITSTIILSYTYWAIGHPPKTLGTFGFGYWVKLLFWATGVTSMQMNILE